MKGYKTKCYYDPDGTWPAMWVVDIWTDTGKWCKKIDGITEKRVQAKARRYMKRRDRRVENHRGYL